MAAGIGAGAKIAIAAGAASAVLIGGGAVAHRVHADNVARQVPASSYSAPAGASPYQTYAAPIPTYSSPESTPVVVANNVTGTWLGDWNRTATGERFAFRMTLSQAADGRVTGLLVGGCADAGRGELE